MLYLFMLVVMSDTLSALEEDYYHKRDGFLLVGPGGSNPECFPTDRPLFQLGCALLCTSSSTCLSFSYRESDNCCVLNSDHLYDWGVQYIEDPAWDYYGPIVSQVSSGEWTLVFKAVNGSGNNFWSAWSTQGVSHDLNLANLNPAFYSKYEISGSYPFYRSHWLDDWPSAGVQEVKVGLYIEGTEVSYMHFNGTGSTNNDWFSHSRLTLHPWMDLSNENPEMFSIEGQLFRKFYVAQSSSFSNCNNFGWLIVLNRQANTCDFDKETPTPQFLYSKGSGGTYFKYKVYGKAEVFAVFVKF